MANVRPSDVVRLIDVSFPWALQDQRGELRHNPPVLFADQSTAVLHLLSKCRELADELLPSGDGRLAYDRAVIRIDQIAGRWKLDNRNAALGPDEMADGTIRHPITTIRMLLEQCPDDPVVAATGSLPFIPDTDVRDERR